MIDLTFEAHSTSKDNEAGLASGWNDVDLSERGIRQSEELGQRYKDQLPDMVFCSDLQRSYKTAIIAFSGLFVSIFTDQRLRECNYGNFTQAPKKQIDIERPNRITKPYPNGESYTQTTNRMRSFLEDLLKHCDNKRVIIIGHRATHYSLDHLINGTSLKELTATHFEYQPGWHYTLEQLR